MPETLVNRWIEDYGEEKTEKILTDFLTEKPITVRCRNHKYPQKEIYESLVDQGVEVKPAPYLPYAYEISNYNHILALDAFIQGKMVVQDVSSMLVAEIANPQKGDYVIDMCAAPGGKSLHVAEKLQLADEVAARENGTEEKTGRVEARDLTEYKTDLIWQNIDRSGLGNICAVCKDASVFDEYDKETADLVIADLPCSGLGVLGKKTRSEISRTTGRS